MTAPPPITPGSIVVAVDGSEHADRAVEWATEQAALERRPLTVVNAAGEGEARNAAWASLEGNLYAMPELLRASRATVDAAVERAHQVQPALTIETRALVGDPRQVLVDMSAQAHMIVMGSRGRGAFRSMFLGSVSAAVSKHAACPVVVCRPGSPDTLTHGVVVGADGSPESLPVIEFAFKLASQRRLRLTAVHCYFDAAAAVAAVDELPQGNEGPDAQADLRLLLSESVAGLSEKYPDVEVSLRLAHGLVDEGLPTLADQAALTVVGHHHGHPMRRWWAGAMATAILERSHGTVVVVPEAEDTEGT